VPERERSKRQRLFGAELESGFAAVPASKVIFLPDAFPSSVKAYSLIRREMAFDIVW
jgi:hypothetical protein